MNQPNALSSVDGWPEPPKLLTRRNLLLAGLLLLFSLAMACLAIYLRRTRTIETGRLWGQDAVVAVQSAPQVWVAWIGTAPPSPGQRAADFQPLEVSFAPNLGHLRHALADDRSYRWEAGPSIPAEKDPPTTEASWVLMDFRGEPMPPVTVRVELESGRVQMGESGPFGQLSDRVRPPVAAFLRQLRKIRTVPKVPG
jgi:hypothetical protein